MQSLKEFLERKREQLEINTSMMAKELRYIPAELYNIESGKSKIPLDFTEKIQKTFDLNDIETQELKHIVSKLPQQKISKKDIKTQKLKHSISEKPLKENAKIQNLEHPVFNSPKQKRAEIQKLHNKTIELIELIEFRDKWEFERKIMAQEYKRSIRKKRVDWGLTMEEMAEKMGYTATWLSSIENGKTSISLKFIKKLQKIFGLNEDELKELYQIKKGDERYKKAKKMISSA